MTATFRVGVLGLTHDHIWHHAPDLSANPHIEVVHVADEHEDLVRTFSQAVNVGQTYARAEDLLDHEQLDVVMIYADNRLSAELAIEAMQRGLHVMVEKPMASTLEQAERMLTAAATYGVKLMVNWPIAWNPPVRTALRLATDGHIGRITHVEYRAAHIGPKEYGCSPYFYDWLYDAERNGGGALMDYCCYGAATARVLLGVPHRISAVGGRYQKEYIQVDDNAVLIMRYPQAIGIAQASWSQVGPGVGAGPTIYGTTGTLVVHQRPGSREGHVVKEGQIEVMTLARPHGELMDPVALPAGERSGLDYFLTCLESNRPIEGLCSPVISRDVQEILAAGYRSMATGCDVSLPLRPAIWGRSGQLDG